MHAKRILSEDRVVQWKDSENRLGLDGWRKSCVHKNLGLRSIMIKIKG